MQNPSKNLKRPLQRAGLQSQAAHPNVLARASVPGVPLGREVLQEPLLKADKYIPSHFVCMVLRHELKRCTEHTRNVFREALGFKPHDVVQMEGHDVACALSPSLRSAKDQAGQVRLFLHGEVYDRYKVKTTPQYLLAEYLKIGDSFARYVNGSYVILILDRLNHVLRVVTDRVNSLKVFFGEVDGCLWLSTSLYLFPAKHLGLDYSGVACYLANGVVHNNRTIFAGVSVLERASIHTIYRGGLKSVRYWEYTFEQAQTNGDEKALRDQLSELILESVRVRTSDDRPVYLSLSGGYDATTILGCLHQLRVKNVRCYSYALGVPKPGSDADVASRQASICGYEHFVLPSYQGDLASTLRRNAIKGQGASTFCDEIDAYDSLQADPAFDEREVLMLGDECFGWKKCAGLTNYSDVLDVVGIHGIANRAWLRRFMDRNVFQALRKCLARDLSSIIDRCPSMSDYHDCKDFLYLDQRLSNVLLQHRDSVLRQSLPVRNPFLDNAILDFMAGVPTQLRLGKSLFIKTARDMFPTLFAIPRATCSGYVPDWRAELLKAFPHKPDWVSPKPGKLDEIIPQKVLQRLLEDGLEVDQDGRLRAFMDHTVNRVLRRLHMRTFYRQPSIVPERFGLSVLTMRFFLDSVSQHPKIKFKTCLPLKAVFSPVDG